MALHDADLVSIQETRDLLKKARAAWQSYRRFSQAQVDRITQAMVDAGVGASESLARLAVTETGMGVVESKTQKNLFATREVWNDIKDLKTVGVVHRDDARGFFQIAEPYGVVLAVVPTTNPTSTALFKAIICAKTRNAMVTSPHPRAVRCIAESIRIVREAAERNGAPPGLFSCMTSPTIEGTQAAMRDRNCDLILATGGPDLVKAAYSAGKPAYGVGPGNVPVYIDRSADPMLAARGVVASQTFDNGTICASEQSLVIDAPIKARVLDAFKKHGAYLVDAAQKAALERVVAKDARMNPAVVGQFPHVIAKMAGFEVPQSTTVLLVEETGVGRDFPLSLEKLCPLLTVYTVEGWKQGCEVCFDVLEYGGLGHTLGIYASDEKVIWQFAEEKPSHRVIVNGPTSQGAVGFSTHLRPSMTLGCGAAGKNITSDNVSAQNLILMKHVGFTKKGFVDAYRVPARGPYVGPFNTVNG
ncbi:MAG: aldehyde dehydrogenase family protein [Planctomycetes bacterium]|nr:aldehyde dehydrogenase family protein [Planctomycetota bacterium]MCC7168856.1 aldehyde dehydrogenase family protein [Planctomycetota bacterium]